MILTKKMISRVFILAMIPAAILLFQNQLSNWHYHLSKNGIVVKHSHPYNKAENTGKPFSSHKHTDFEYFVLGQLASLATLIAFAIMALAFVFAIYSVLQFSGFRFPFLRQQYLALQPMRAPPAIF